MEKTIVIYYSNNGSNSFLAKKITEQLDCDMEELRPRINSHLFLMFGPRIGNKPLKSDLSDYDRVILVGPVWMGKLINPLRDFILKYRSKIGKLIFVTCCGSSFKVRDEKFGHGHVFRKAEEVFGGPVQCEAFPIPLVLAEDKQEDPELIMSTRLTEENFDGKVRSLFDEFIRKVSV